MTKRATLYFHYPCFDGIVSAALAWEFLEQRKGWSVGDLCPVNYTVRNSWLSQRTEAPASRLSIFSTIPARISGLTIMQPQCSAKRQRPTISGVGQNSLLYFDEQAGSCASLLFRHLGESLADKPHFHEMVEWAEKIDSARYASVEEAILGDAPALKINRSILFEPGADYARFLCKELRNHPLDARGYVGRSKDPPG